MTDTATPKKRNRILEAIAIYKFAKVVLSLAAAVAAFRLVNADVGVALREWASALPMGFFTHLLRRGLEVVTDVSAHRMEQLGFIFIGYAVLFGIEGAGLWREKLWAEWLTIGTSASLMPFEVYEVARHTTGIRVGVLVTNAAVVVYLVTCVIRLHRQRNAERAARQAERT